MNVRVLNFHLNPRDLTPMGGKPSAYDTQSMSTHISIYIRIEIYWNEFLILCRVFDSVGRTGWLLAGLARACAPAGTVLVSDHGD